MPAPGVMAQGQRIAAAFDFRAQYECVQRSCASLMEWTCASEDDRRDRCGGMDDRRRMGIVEIEDVGRHGVHGLAACRISAHAPSDRVGRTGGLGARGPGAKSARDAVQRRVGGAGRRHRE